MTTGVPAAVRAVYEKNKGELLRRVDTLDEAVAAMLDGHLGEDLRGRAERDAHKLSGSLGMFGLREGSEQARGVEEALGVADGPAPAEAPRLAELVLGVRGELDKPPAESPANGEVGRPPSDGRALLLVSPDPVLLEHLGVEAHRQNMRPRKAASSADARRSVAGEAPDAAVLDLNFSGGDADGLELLVDLAGSRPPIPVVVLTASEALVDRVEVARRGGRGFIQRTRPARHVIDAVSETIERRDLAEAKLLVVDDDTAVSDAVAALLTPVGLDVATLNDPQLFWERLEAVNPDLLMLDLDMPGLDGIDLCRVVRADVRFGQLPVLFLTSHADSDSIQRIFEAGADDFVSKPIVGPELVTRIQNRLERLRLYREHEEIDSLTRVGSRRTSTAALGDLIALAERSGQPLSVALINLDQFKELNDRIGRAAGDAALERIGAMLTEAFPGDDVVGRWGGEEFVVGTYGMVRDDGVQRVAEVLESFRAERFTGPDGRTSGVSFSAGVAEFPADGHHLDELCRAADEALVRAKAEGRNRVLPAGAAREPSGHPDVVVVDDDSALAGLLIESLETRGHRTHCLGDGLQAVAALAGARPRIVPDLILLDVDLPGIDGLSILRRLADDGVLNRTRVIMLTARAGETEVLEALELGAFDHVAKPFSVPVLMQRVRRALRR